MFSKTWEEVERKYKNACEMSCKPDFKRMHKDYITDDEKSVKWNREQVEENHKQYDEAVKELNTKKNKCCNEALKDIYAKIQEDVGHNLSEKAAERIWYDADYDFGHLQNQCDLISDILDDMER